MPGDGPTAGCWDTQRESLGLRLGQPTGIEQPADARLLGHEAVGLLERERRAP